VHRDLKPENILVSSSGDIKIIDFGLARKIGPNNLNEVVGTPYYMAPEVLNANYGVECDMWSVGVLVYVMLSGYLPFAGNNTNEVFAKILLGRVQMDQPEWKEISEDAKDMVRQLLTVNANDRMKVDEALSHDWFNLDEVSTN